MAVRINFHLKSIPAGPATRRVSQIDFTGEVFDKNAVLALREKSLRQARK